MPQIEFMDNEAPALVEQIDDLLQESGDFYPLVVILASDGMNVLANDGMTDADLEDARMKIEGLAQHFDRIVEQARRNGRANT